MTKDELVRQAEKRISYNITTVMEEKAFIEGFVCGAEWMQAQMQDTNEGKALLYAVNKTEERVRKETIRKAAKFIYDTILNWADDSYCQTLSECRMDYINKFKQAMEE